MPALRTHGIPVQNGRTAAIRQLVLQAPAPVVAGMLAHDATTTAYETAVWADEALSLNVEDVDVGNKRAVIISGGGDRGLLYFQTGSARLLPRLLAGRWRGPLFLAERSPVPARVPAAEDLSPQRPGPALLPPRSSSLLPLGDGSLHDLRRQTAPSGGQAGDGPNLSAAAVGCNPRLRDSISEGTELTQLEGLGRTELSRVWEGGI